MCLVSGCFFQKIPTLQYACLLTSVHMRRAPLKDSIFITLLCLLLWKVEISLFLSQSVPFLPAFFPNCSSCLSSSCCMDQFWPTNSASHHILGWSWLFFLSSATQQRLLFLYQSFHPCKGSMSISISLLLLSFHLWKRSVNTSTS